MPLTVSTGSVRRFAPNSSGCDSGLLDPVQVGLALLDFPQRGNGGNLPHELPQGQIPGHLEHPEFESTTKWCMYP